MSYEITLTPETHGYTIRLEKRSFTDGGKEVSETVSILAIICDRKIAYAVFNGLNSLLSVCVRKKIFDEQLFEYKGEGKKDDS